VDPIARHAAPGELGGDRPRYRYHRVESPERAPLDGLVESILGSSLT
jgi:hypothetical protein